MPILYAGDALHALPRRVLIAGTRRVEQDDAGGSDRADCMVWLDLPRRVVMRQVVGRTVRRRLRRERLWHGNVEPPLWTIVQDRGTSCGGRGPPSPKMALVRSRNRVLTRRLGTGNDGKTNRTDDPGGRRRPSPLPRAHRANCRKWAAPSAR